MNYLLNKRLFIVSILVFVSCARPGVSRYDFIPSERYVVENEIVLDQPFDKTWDRLVEKLSSSFYVINNIEKASRLINVSFSTNEPEIYIDCGKSIRYYERNKEYLEYKYKVAESSSFKVAGVTTISSPMTTFIERKTSLEGRVNIYVAPIDDKTKIIVNVRYILNINVNGYSALENRLGVVAGYEQMPTSISSLSFSTNVENKENVGDSRNPIWVTCYSSGKLEEEILAFAKISEF